MGKGLWYDHCQGDWAGQENWVNLPGGSPIAAALYWQPHQQLGNDMSLENIEAATHSEKLSK